MTRSTDRPRPAATGRRRVGGDVYLAAYPPGSEHALRVDTGFEPPDWKAATEGGFHRASFPGTAILVDERWYEIARVTTSAGAPRRTYYDLRPWDDSATLRTVFELTPEACQELTRRHKEQEARRRHSTALALLPVFTGLLPAADQERLERDYGVSAERGTAISAMVLLLASVVVVAMTAALALGLHFGEYQVLARKLSWYSPLALYLVLESIFRLRSRVGPLGSLPVVLPLYVLRGLREAATSGDRPQAVRSDVRGILGVRDRVRRVEGPQGGLLVISRLPKEHWTANVTGIEYEGETYVLMERAVIETDNGPRHRFLLRPPAHEMVFRSFVRYRPEEVQDIYREERRVRSAQWVESVPIFWGLLEGTTQKRLAGLYKYDPELFTGRTILVSAIAGAFLVLRGGALMSADLARFGDAAGLIFGIFLLWEAALRRSKLAAGELPGSVLGIPLKPLAARFLRWEVPRA